MTGAAAQTTPVTWVSVNENNAGDVWVDNVGVPQGTGHEQDPHLSCADINLWGNDLADSSGKFTIDGWNPSGSGSGDFGSQGYQQDQAWPNTKASPAVLPGAGADWSYSGTGNKIIAVINVDNLIAHAKANGDAPVNSQGFHFKLQFSQDPQKHKTFWVACDPSTPTPSPSAATSPTPTPTPTHGPTPTPTPTHTPAPSPSPTPTGGVQGATPTPTASPASGVLGIVGVPNTGGGGGASGLGLVLSGLFLLTVGGLVGRRKHL